jgi:hypothetical protein
MQRNENVASTCVAISDRPLKAGSTPLAATPPLTVSDKAVDNVRRGIQAARIAV